MRTLNLKLIFVTALFSAFTSLEVLAQNNAWSIPPNYIEDFGNINPGPLPTPNQNQGDLEYDGSVAQHAHNAIASPNGDLLFFVVDNAAYDPDGWLMYKFVDSEGDWVSGNSEICIVPDPASCGEQFYIFMANSEIDNVYNYPYCTQLDLSAQSLVFEEDPTKKGAPVYGGYDMENITRLDELVNFEDVNNNSLDFDVLTHEGFAFAASPLLSDGSSHLVLFSFGSQIFRILVDETGLHAINPPIEVDDVFPSYTSQEGYGKSELELCPLSNGNFRVGITYPGANNKVVAAFDIDENGDQVLGTSYAYPLVESSSNVPHVKGLEFSENGRYLYFTHHETNDNPDVIQYLDMDLSTTETLNVANDNAFEYSQIELGINGKLYFAYANGLASLQDSNNPASTWNPSDIQTTINLSHSGYPANEELYAYLLPDQNDGMDYTDILDYPYANFTTQNIETWTPLSNPFSTNGGSVVRISDELRIESGAIITIENMRFEFFEDARVVIEPGGQLRLDNTTLTVGPCGAEMWLGVEVWGDPSVSQYPYSNQGYL